MPEEIAFDEEPLELGVVLEEISEREIQREVVPVPDRVQVGQQLRHAARGVEHGAGRTWN